MKVIFLDFDGVLNSEASVILSIRRRIMDPSDETPVNEDLCPVCTSNFQLVLDNLPDVKIVVSSSWRRFFTLEQLREKLKAYGIDGDRVIDVTPVAHHMESGPRGDDITEWLAFHPEVKDYAIVDDMDCMTTHMEHLVLTNYSEGLTLDKALELIKLLDRTFDINKNIMKSYLRQHSQVRQAAANDD